MIEKVIEYLTQPAGILYSALNTVDLLAAVNSDEIKVYAYEEQQRRYPYVILKEHGDGINGKGILNAGYSEERVFVVECYATAPTALAAKQKVSIMALACEAQIYVRKGTIQEGTITQVDLGGTGSYDKIVNWWLRSTSAPQVEGPGTDLNNPTYVAKSIVKVVVQVMKVRIR